MNSESKATRTLVEYIKREQKKTNLGKYWYKHVIIEVSAPTQFSVKLCLDSAFSKFQTLNISKYIKHIEVVERSVLSGNNAYFKRGKIYIANDLEKDTFVESLVHEISHGLIKSNQQFFFDNDLLSEFIRKRRALYSYLESYGYDVDQTYFLSLANNDMLKDYLKTNVGYNKLVHFASGLFPTINAITSPVEYVAEAFEMSLNGDAQYVASISPEAFKKIKKFLFK
jgi:hypothetical protein